MAGEEELRSVLTITGGQFGEIFEGFHNIPGSSTSRSQQGFCKISICCIALWWWGLLRGVGEVGASGEQHKSCRLIWNLQIFDFVHLSSCCYSKNSGIARMNW